MKTSAEWWLATKSDPAKLTHWLQRQYVGEMAAVNLLSELLIRFGDEATDEEAVLRVGEVEVDFAGTDLGV